jgi:hypothetical protein
MTTITIVLNLPEATETYRLPELLQLDGLEAEAVWVLVTRLLLDPRRERSSRGARDET